ncbi:hypothetical protein KSS87_014617 [Heliosperma pusillum]|nr:hypothetical protein KSS87_014617 [Heliosperma pusillum]
MHGVSWLSHSPVRLDEAPQPRATPSEVNRNPERDLQQCEQKCQRQQPYFEERKCRQLCQAIHQQRDDIGRVSVGGAEREYERCQRTCGGSGKVQWTCQRRCQDTYEAALRRDRKEREHERERGHEHRGDREEREREYKDCMRRCEDREEGFARQRQCKLRCEDRHGRSEHRRNGELVGERGLGKDDNKHHKSKDKEESDNNPFYFDSKSFKTRYSTQEGNMSVLERFSEKSELLQGIDKYRVGFYEANPNTFMLPHHWDADSVLFVIKGKAAMTFVTQEKRENFNLERGDVLVVPAGTTAYLVNSDNYEKLQIVELLRPVNNPGQYEQYFSVGGEENESFLNIFSSEILQAALDVPKEEIERMFEQQNEGTIIKARQDQVRAMAQRGMSTESFGSSRSVFNLLNEEPIYSNDHGEYYIVTPNDYEELENLDVSVAYCDLNEGSMMAPNFNSKATHIVLVEEGSGYVEMASPHAGKQSNKKQKERESSGPRYQKVRSSLSKGDAIVIPAGLPFAIVSSENENLRMIGFGINARNNKRNFLAGQENMINQLDDEAKELAFKMPARQVEEMFMKQQNSFFMAGPQQQQRQQQQQQQPQRKGESPLLSVLSFAGL